jgi:hypothetical protein
VNDVAFSVDGSTLLTASVTARCARADVAEPPEGDGRRGRTPGRRALRYPAAVDPNGGRRPFAGSDRVAAPGRRTPRAGPRTRRPLCRLLPDRTPAAAGEFQSPPEDSVVRVLDLDGGGVTLLPFAKAGEGVDGGTNDLAFVDEHRLLAIGPNGVRLLDVRDRSQKLLSSRPSWRLAGAADATA